MLIDKALILFTCLSILTSYCPVLASYLSDPVDKAILLIDQAKYSSALAYLDALIVKEPKNARAYIERSIVFGRAGSFDKAASDSDRAIYLAPNNGKAHTFKAAVHLAMGQLQNALAHTNRAIKSEPKYPTAHAMKSLILARLKKYNEAIVECSKAIALRSADSSFYMIRAAIYRDFGQYNSALIDCNKAIGLAPNKAKAYLERGKIHLHFSNRQKAIADFSIATKCSATSTDDYALRAQAYSCLGDYTKEIENLTLAFNLFSQSQTLLEQRIDASYTLLQLQNVIRDCARLDSSSETQQYAISAYRELGQYDQAIALLNKLIAAQPRLADLYASRAYCKEMQKNFEEAQPDWKAAWNIANNDEKVELKLNFPLIDFGGTNCSKIHASQLQKKIGVERIPFHLRDGGQIAVLVRINGKLHELALDTGCAHTMIWKSAMQPTGQRETVVLRRKLANGDDHVKKILRVEQLHFGESFSDFLLPVEKCISEQKTVHGLLGGNILENFAVTIDFQSNQLVLASSFEPEEKNNLISIPMTLHDHRPFCRVRLDNKVECMALLDTDARSMGPDVFFQSLLSSKLRYEDHIQGPWLGKLCSSPVKLKTISAESDVFGAPKFDVFRAPDAPLASSFVVLGLDFLSQFNKVTFDYPGRRVIFEPKENNR